MTDYNKIEQVKTIIQDLLKAAGFEAGVEFEESIIKGLVFNISSPDSYLLIGRQGATLHSLQILVQSIATKQLGSGEPLWFTIDIDDYKRKREWFLKETAKAAAEQVKKTGRSLRLEIMPNYERRFVHAYLQEHFPGLFSESMGEDPYRRIVIKLKR